MMRCTDSSMIAAYTKDTTFSLHLHQEVAIQTSHKCTGIPIEYCLAIDVAITELSYTHFVSRRICEMSR